MFDAARNEQEELVIFWLVTSSAFLSSNLQCLCHDDDDDDDDYDNDDDDDNDNDHGYDIFSQF